LFLSQSSRNGGQTADVLLPHAGVQRYQNLSGNSGVVEFKNQPDFIIVRFDGGDLYVYMSEKLGRRHVEEMKRLAVAGKGLSTYITQHRDVFNGYVRYDPAVPR
jgi:hypothetical protein